MGGFAHSARLIGLGVACLAGAFILAGCLASGSASVKTSGQYVSGKTLALIEPGKSSQRELVDLLGPPTRTMHHHDGRTIYVYHYTLDAKGSGGVLLLAWGSGRQQVERTTYFELEDGVVSRYWTDGATDEIGEWAHDTDSNDTPDSDWEEIS